jgi:hypothetical protein
MGYTAIDEWMNELMVSFTQKFAYPPCSN